MMFTYLIISALATLTLADSIALQTSTITELKCSTSYGARSIAPPLPTSTATKTIRFLPWIGTSVVTPISTVTPPPTTQTATKLVTVTVITTNNAVTDTFSTTSTIFTTNINTQVVTSTIILMQSFSTTTTTSTTTLVPTSSGFLPVESTTATAYPNTPSRRLTRNKRATTRKGGTCRPSFPNRISLRRIFFNDCFHTYPTAKTTTLAPATATTTITSTSTSTSTVVPPNVTVTSSSTATSAVDSTITSTALATSITSTTSTLIVTSTSSLYAACTSTSSNILGPQTPHGLIEAITGDSTFIISTPGSPYACCVECQLSNTCAGTFYSVGSQDVDGQCIQIQSSQCSSQAGFSRGYQTNSVDNGFTYIVSNGNCGYLYYGGIFG